MAPSRFRLILALQFVCGKWSRVPLLACGLGLIAPLARADDPEPPPLPERPYEIRAWISVDPSARLAPGHREALIDDWESLVRRFIGTPWRLEVADDDGPLLGLDLDAIDLDTIAEAVEKADKGWLIRIERTGGNQAGLTLSGREFDSATRQLGPIHRQSAPFPKDVARSLFQLSRALFTPSAEVERDGDRIALLVQGAALRPADAVGQVLREGDIFRPYWVFLDPADRSVRGIRDVPYTYLRVDSESQGTARCSIISALARPLPQQVAGRYRLVARGVRAADYPSEFRFVYGQDGDPAAGCVVTVHRYPDGPPREVGTPDRDGRIVLPPRFDTSLMMLRVLAGGLEPLREMPVLPGETAEVRTIPVEPRPLTVTLISRLRALQDQIVDLIAVRSRLEARLQARADGQQWDEVGTLLKQYKQLKPRAEFARKLDELKANAERQQADLGIPILTRTARAQLAETEALITSYLDDEAFEAYVDAYQRSQEPGATTETAEAPANRLIDTQAPAPAPAPAPAEKEQPKPAPAPPRGGPGPVVPF
ncbi:hypothetical protein BH23PLA1_BH23PLA1_09720 [soil metagenome]